MHNIQSPRTDDNAIEQEIQAKGKTAPRVTPAEIEANIASEHYFTAADGVDGHNIAVLRASEPTAPLEVAPMSDDPDLGKTGMAPLRLLTFCVLVLGNGFTVTGESACASPENFDAEIGRKIARQNAVNKIWPLMGYALKQQLHDVA
ncbi:N4 Gp49/Sf6 Gp66 family protein [Cupriavidus phytorum]|uniref:N4 Gp49/Sf6 Gp66 family protein n=1 Tax=Cupriavidus phytorum TaxID=3024399 RepID=A0A2W7QUZ4_9BURK|nr:Gp49 family protein [Cupriavidus alkaliphilus]PZX29462.1 N4 Gp49/Sf6 Gp66 family protein [Cupriavidus alkaliphilus]